MTFKGQAFSLSGGRHPTPDAALSDSLFPWHFLFLGLRLLLSLHHLSQSRWRQGNGHAPADRHWLTKSMPITHIHIYNTNRPNVCLLPECVCACVYVCVWVCVSMSVCVCVVPPGGWSSGSGSSDWTRSALRWPAASVSRRTGPIVRLRCARPRWCSWLPHDRPVSTLGLSDTPGTTWSLSEDQYYGQGVSGNLFTFWGKIQKTCSRCKPVHILKDNTKDS